MCVLATWDTGHSLETSPQWLVCFSIEQGNELEGRVAKQEKKDQEARGIVTIVMLYQLYLEVKNVEHVFNNSKYISQWFIKREFLFLVISYK